MAFSWFMAASSSGFVAPFEFKLRRLVSSHGLELKKRRRVCFKGDQVALVIPISSCSSEVSILRAARFGRKAEEWRLDRRKSHRRFRVHASSTMPFASPEYVTVSAVFSFFCSFPLHFLKLPASCHRPGYASKQEKFSPRCTPKNSSDGPQSRDTPPKRGNPST